MAFLDKPCSVSHLHVRHEAGDEGDGPEDDDANDEQGETTPGQVLALRMAGHRKRLSGWACIGCGVQSNEEVSFDS